MHFFQPRISRFGGEPILQLSKTILDACCLVLQYCQCEPVVVSSRDVADLGLRLLQLCLTEFDNRSQSKMIAGLREAEREVRLIDELLRNREAVVSRLCVEPTRAYVA